MSRYPTRFQEKTLWNALTGLAMLTIGTLIVGAIWLIGKLFGFFQPVLVPLIVAAIVAYLLEPVVRWLEKRGMKRMWAVITLLTTLLVAAGLLVATLIPGIQKGRAMALKGWQSAKQSQASPAPEDPKSETPDKAKDATADEAKAMEPRLAKAIFKIRQDHAGDLIGWALTETDDDGKPGAHAITKIEDATSLDSFWNSRAGRTLVKYKGSIIDTSKRWLSAGTNKVVAFLGLFLGMIMVPVYLFFLLMDSASIRENWHRYVPLRASRFKDEFISTLSEINGYLISFFRGQVLVAMLDGIMVGIALEIYDLPYGFLIGVFMALLGIIPYIGNVLCLIPACIIAYIHAQGGEVPFGLSPWGYVGGTLAIFFLVQQINSLVTTPKIVGDSVGLHPLTVIFSLLFWSLVLGGFVGALLAVPLTASIKVIFSRFFWERQMRAGDAAAGDV